MKQSVYMLPWGVTNRRLLAQVPHGALWVRLSQERSVQLCPEQHGLQAQVTTS